MGTISGKDSKAGRGTGNGMRQAGAPRQPHHTQPLYQQGPRAVSALLPAITRPVFRKSAPGIATLLADWPSIAGPVLAAAAIPRKLSGGTLVLACSGPAAMELQHSAPQLIQRINLHAGRTLVERLRLVQEAPAMISPAPKKAPPPSAAARAAVEAKVEATLGDLPEGGLRDALAALGAAVLTRR